MTLLISKATLGFSAITNFTPNFSFLIYVLHVILHYTLIFDFKFLLQYKNSSELAYYQLHQIILNYLTEYH